MGCDPPVLALKKPLAQFVAKRVVPIVHFFFSIVHFAVVVDDLFGFFLFIQCLIIFVVDVLFFVVIVVLFFFVAVVLRFFIDASGSCAKGDA